MRLWYYSHDWLFTKRCRFLLYGKTYESRTGNFERDNDSEIWDWYDDVQNPKSAEVVEKLLNCKSAKIRHTVSRYYDDKTISSKKLTAIKDTVQFFNKLKS